MELVAVFPLAAYTILDSTIVDDVMESVPTEEEAEELIRHLKIIIESCGMTIHKWASSHPTSTYLCLQYRSKNSRMHPMIFPREKH